MMGAGLSSRAVFCCAAGHLDPMDEKRKNTPTPKVLVNGYKNSLGLPEG